MNGTKRILILTADAGFSHRAAANAIAADCIVCKAGGLIVTESLACGLPILLTDFIEGQETSNARCMVEGEAGELAHNPLEGLETIFHWLAGWRRASSPTRPERQAPWAFPCGL